MAKAKAFPYEIINKDESPELYELLDNLVAEHHTDLAEANANIVLAWRNNWKTKNGRLTLGTCQLVGPLDAALHGYDFIICLNKKAWGEFKESQRRALLDHELCHAGASKDEDGTIREDERGRAIFGIRKHDMEEFQCIVKRHGSWLGDIEVFAINALSKKDRPLLPAGPAKNGDARPTDLPGQQRFKDL